MLYGNNPCPSVDEWPSKTLYMHVMELLFALKRNEILTYAIWTSLEDVTLSDISQT